MARFTEPGLRESLTAVGIETIACDLLDRAAIEKLPKSPNVIYMAGRKFGASGDTSLTWAMNVLVPAYVAEIFARSRIVAFSSGNIYPFMPVGSQGATEDTPTLAPPNDYSYSCLGRERMFQYFSNLHKTPGRLFRLNYAIDMRYGVIHDVCAKVRDGAEIDLTVGHANVIWQGDANSFALRCLAHATAPTSPINISGPETAQHPLARRAVRQAARQETDLRRSRKAPRRGSPTPRACAPSSAIPAFRSCAWSSGRPIGSRAA